MVETLLSTGAHSPVSPPVEVSAPTALFIAGAWRAASDGSTFPVLDPATGQSLADVASATAEDGAAALDAASSSQDGWAATAPRARAELLRAAFELLTARTEQFATLITLEMGKPLAESRAEVTYAAEFLRWFAEEAPRINGRFQTSPAGTSRILVTRRAVGPCLFITPWNFPLAMATRKLAPALAAGCTSILKPAAATPLTALAFAALLAEVGVPAGAVNVVPSASARAVTAPILADARLRKLSFTGSTEVGKSLLSGAAMNVLRTSMELGGDAPFIVFDDADLDAVIPAALIAKLRNMGEACTAANRFLVHHSLAEDFAERLSEAFAAMTTGPGLEPTTDVGPLIDGGARDSVHEIVQDGVRDGARVLTGGSIPAGTGWYYPPTVLTDVRADSRILGKEIFGPVAPVLSFTEEDEAIALANSSAVGLAGYVFTRDVSRLLRLADHLEVGMIGVNQGIVSDAAAPFGGVKHSGLGREGGLEGIEEFLETIYLSIGS